jgi:hypothetical protein
MKYPPIPSTRSMPLACQDGDRAGWHHTIARFSHRLNRGGITGAMRALTKLCQGSTAHRVIQLANAQRGSGHGITPTARRGDPSAKRVSWVRLPRSGWFGGMFSG